MTEIKKFMGQNITNILKVQSTRVDDMDAYMNIELEKFFDPPEAPTVDSITYSSATVTSVDGAEVSLDLANWYDSPYDFTGLDSNTSYTAYARMKATETIPASDPSTGTDFNTLEISLGTTVSAESYAVFDSANISWTAVDTLSPTKAIVAYEYTPSNDKLAGCVLNLSGSTVTASSRTIFSDTYAHQESVAALSDTKAIVVWKGGSNDGLMCVYTISGNSISKGTTAYYTTANIDSPNITALSSTTAVVVYWNDDSSDRGEARIITMDGTSVSAGAAQVFNSSRSWYPSVAKVDTNKIIVTYGDSTLYGRARIGTVSGDSISWGSVATFESARTSWTSVCALSSSKALVTYCDRGNSDRGTACVLDISGTTITPGTPEVFETGAISNDYVTAFNSETALVVYRDLGNSNAATACVLTVDGSSVSDGTLNAFDGGSGYHCVTTMDDNKAIAVYDDDDNNGYGTSCLLEVPIV